MAAVLTDLGELNIVVALAIATFKATLVVLFFMHAKYSPKRTHLVIVCAVFWLRIMLALYPERLPDPSANFRQLEQSRARP